MVAASAGAAGTCPLALSSPTEIELKFLVPAAAVAAVAAEMARAAPHSGGHQTLAAMYLDTPDRRLARAGLAWRLRREDERWVQTLKAGHGLVRFEHEVLRDGADFDPTAHAGSAAGDQLLRLLQQGASQGQAVGVRFQTEVQRQWRRMRTRAAVVELAFDRGQILAGDQRLALCELEFELVSGPVQDLIALARRWCRRFGLQLDPRSKAARGDALADGRPLAPVREAVKVDYRRGSSAAAALGLIVDECSAQISANAIGLHLGDAAARAEHVHQLRVGVRRLRTAWRCFDGWAAAPDPALVNELRRWFAALGATRDQDVLAGGVAAELLQAGAPPQAAAADITNGAADAGSPPPSNVAVDEAAVQLDLLAWRLALEADDVNVDLNAEGEAGTAAPADPSLRRRARQRLRRWHRRLAADSDTFDDLSDDALHDLRKRVKRQRYALEFFAPLLPRRALSRYRAPLVAAQTRLGRLNDLFVARAHYQALAAAAAPSTHADPVPTVETVDPAEHGNSTDAPSAWFAQGWLAAQIGIERRQARKALAALAKADPP